MKTLPKLLSFMTFLLVSQVTVFAQTTDTLYYDKNWKGVESRAFASFYRILSNSTDGNYQKRFRDFYITGELQSEGGYISIDKYDDSKSVFDGEWTNYYKSGKVEQKGNRVNGIEQGDYTAYYENGLVKLHAFMKDGKAEGILTQFNENGDLCSQVEMQNGEPKYNLIKSLAWYRCSTLMVPCATLSRYRSYHSLGTGTTEVI